MRLKTNSIILLSAAVLSLSLPLRADPGQFYLAPGFQWMDFNADESLLLGRDEGFFLGLGFQFTDRLSGELSTFDLEAQDSLGNDTELDHYKVDLLWDLSDGANGLTPFLVGGVGRNEFGDESDTLFDLGVGLKVDLTDNLQWRTAIRRYEYDDRDTGIDTSLVFYFGDNRRAPAAPTPEPEPMPVDSDGDGVPDSRDQCPDTPMNYAVDADGCPIPVEEVARVELEVLFEFDRSEVRPQYFNEIKEVTDFMEQYPDVVVELEGHTDSIGTNEYNLGLAQRRVDAVREVMIDEFGIQGSRITTRSFGEEQPVASNNTPAGRAQNRRVVTVIIRTLQRYQPR